MPPRHIALEELLTYQEKIIVVMQQHRLGDCVAFEPVVPWLRQHYPSYKLAWAIREQYLEALIAHPMLDYILPATTMKQWVQRSQSFPGNIKTVAYDFWPQDGSKAPHNMLRPPSNMPNRQNYFFWDGLLGCYSFKAGLPKLNGQPNFYIAPGTALPCVLPDVYVAFHTSSQDISKDWMPEKWSALADWFIRQGIAVVELGWVKSVTADSGLYYDLTKLSLHQTALVLKGVKCFFGVDSGLAHIANALQVDGVCLLGALERHGTVYTRHVPYTGLYARHHILRAPGKKPASLLTVQQVTDFYQKKDTAIWRLKDAVSTFYTSKIYNFFWRVWYSLKEVFTLSFHI